MIHKFEEWRKAKAESCMCNSLAHFHKVEDCVLRDVYDFMQALLCVRVEKCSPVITIRLNDSLCNSLLLFIEQMRFAYLHPRSDSARFLFAASVPPLANPSRNNPKCK